MRPGARPDELVPGDPDEVLRLAVRLTQFASAARDAAAGLSTLDSEHWSGRAAELFRAAVGAVPRQQTSAAEAFSAAARTLSAYAAVLRDAQSTAAAGIRLLEHSTPDSRAADQATADGLVERARAAVAEAGQSAAARLSEAAADAPAGSGMKRPGRLPALRADGISVQVISEHRLAEPDQYLAPVHDLAGTVRFDHDHKVEFAGPGPGAAVGYQDWQAWAEQHPGRGLGRIGPEVLAGLGVGAGGLSAAVRRRRWTAWALAGLDEAALRSRVEQHTGAQQGGVAAPVGAGAWRTRLASPAGSGGAVHSWAGPEDDPLPGARRAEAVRLPAADRQTSGLVPRIGPPESERDPGSGAS